MLDDIVGNYGGRLLVAAGGVGLALLALIGVLWLMRNRAPSPFVRGGKNRQPRLQVLDAAAVDARRRLVLVRRDGVEHLIMIGGPTDIVIESGIGDSSRSMPLQPVPLETLAAPEPRPVQKLEPIREQPRVIARQPEPEKQLPTPPQRAAIEAPVAPPVEKRELPRTAAAAPPAAPAAAAIVAAAPVAERLQPVAVTPTPPPRAPEPAPERREVADAVDILEAARQRVLPPKVEEPQKISDKEPSPLAPPPAPPVAPPQTPILAQDAYREAVFEADGPEPEDLPAIPAPRQQLGSDFESILEAEMSSNLKAERIVSPAPAALKPASPDRREPDMAATRDGDAALQSEVARIFGEINVKDER